MLYRLYVQLLFFHLTSHLREPKQLDNIMMTASLKQKNRVGDATEVQDDYISSTKVRLKTALTKTTGSTKNPEVMEIINSLSTAVTSQVNWADCSQLLGHFVAHSSPDFPGRIQQAPGNEDVIQYTLGKLSFGIFQPHSLVCTVLTCRNSIRPIPGEASMMKYDLFIDIIIHTPDGDFPAVIKNEAVCAPHTTQVNRLTVVFKRGNLAPAAPVLDDPKKHVLWKKTFKDAYAKAQEERSLLSRVAVYFLKLIFQLSTPTDAQAEKSPRSNVSFEMKFSPRGHIDILYLDEEIRITKGNRGTVIVVERMQDPQESER